MSCPMSTYKAYNQGRSSKCPTYNYSSQFTIYALLFCILILTKNLIKLVEIATFCKMNSSDISLCGSQQVPQPETTRSQLVSALSDAMFVSPGVHSAGTFARRRNNTFFFQFSHQTKSGMYAEVTQGVS